MREAWGSAARRALRRLGALFILALLLLFLTGWVLPPEVSALYEAIVLEDAASPPAAAAAFALNRTRAIEGLLQGGADPNAAGFTVARGLILGSGGYRQ